MCSVLHPATSSDESLERTHRSDIGNEPFFSLWDKVWGWKSILCAVLKIIWLSEASPHQIWQLRASEAKSLEVLWWKVVGIVSSPVEMKFPKAKPIYAVQHSDNWSSLCNIHNKTAEIRRKNVLHVNKNLFFLFFPKRRWRNCFFFLVLSSTLNILYQPFQINRLGHSKNHQQRYWQKKDQYKSKRNYKVHWQGSPYYLLDGWSIQKKNLK